MEFSIKYGSPETISSDCLVVGVYDASTLSPSGQLLNKASKRYLAKIIREGDMSGHVGQSTLLYDVPNIKAKRILLVGCGVKADLDAPTFSKIVGNTISQLQDLDISHAHSYLSDLKVKQSDPVRLIKLTTLAANSQQYQFNQFKGDAKSHKLKKLFIATTSDQNKAQNTRALQQGKAIARGIELTKNLGNLPGNICTPSYLASEARALAKRHKNLSVKVMEENAMEKMGMGSLLSVSRGSRQPAKLITMQYSGGKKTQKPIALVGKGVTFDTGGVSLKPGAAMDEMKYDMCGAASVLGTFSALAEMKLAINVVGIIPACENMPDGAASRPGDIVTSLSGQTIEILNTDAEGRLILCDALTYSAQFKPEVTIDIATLTGACVIALGGHATGMYASDDGLAADLIAAGENSGDRAWRMPLWEEYQQQLDSNFADMANIGGREGGSITAACFLSRFTKGRKWSHLDIAGTAWLSGKNKGATGRPVGLLTEYLIKQSL